MSTNLAPITSAVAAPTHLLGHVGQLTPQEASALGAFKKLISDKGLYKPAGVGVKATHDDELLLRFLRARKFQPQDALKQFSDTEVWRKQNQIKDVYENIDCEEYEETRRSYPQWTGRRDKRGLPVYVYKVGNLNLKQIDAHSKKPVSTLIPTHDVHPRAPPRLLRLFALYENLIQFVLPFCTAIPDRAHPETPISQSNNIVDISGVGLKQFWNLRSHMQDASQLATAHYPETLDRIFIIGAPSFFPTVWGWVKRWFDPITVSKIFILSAHEVTPTLTRFIDIENVPKAYGGTLPYEFGMLPILEPAFLDILQWGSPEHRSIPIGPTEWQDDGKGNKVMVAVGTVNGKDRRQPIAVLKVDASIDGNFGRGSHGDNLGGHTNGITAGPRNAAPAVLQNGMTKESLNSMAGGQPNGHVVSQQHDPVTGQIHTNPNIQQNGTAVAGALDDNTVSEFLRDKHSSLGSTRA